MGSSSLGDFIVGAGLDSMDQIGELHGILDEENGNVVANNIYLMSWSEIRIVLPAVE